MKSKLFASFKYPLSMDVALLLVRVVCGYAFVLHGWGKIQHPFSWMGPESTFPVLLQALVALAEFGGGVALILGILTRLGAFGIGCTMVGAVYLHRFVMGDPFVNLLGGGSYELAAVFLVIAFLLMVAGSGRFSLDRVIFGEK